MCIFGKTTMGAFYSIQREEAEEILSDVGLPLPRF